MKGRLRIHIIQNRMTYAEADTLSWYLEEQENVTEVKVYERTADAVICYKGEREEILTVLKQFSCKLTVRSSFWDTKANKAAGKSLEAQRINRMSSSSAHLQV